MTITTAFRGRGILLVGDLNQNLFENHGCGCPYSGLWAGATAMAATTML